MLSQLSTWREFWVAGSVVETIHPAGQGAVVGMEEGNCRSYHGSSWCVNRVVGSSVRLFDSEIGWWLLCVSGGGVLLSF